MATSILNLDIEAGVDFYFDAQYTDYTTNLPKDLTGYHATMELRYEWDDPRILLVLSDVNNGILLGGITGVLTTHFTPAMTNPNQQTPYSWDRAVYDLIITDINGVKTKLLKGFVNVSGTVSY